MSGRCWVIALPCVDPGGKEVIEYWRGTGSWNKNICKTTRRFASAEEALETFSLTEADRNPGILDKIQVTEIEVKDKESKVKRPPCVSGKRPYPTEDHALRDLVNLWADNPDRPHRQERRAYDCPLCKYWHLTKVEEYEPRR